MIEAIEPRNPEKGSNDGYWGLGASAVKDPHSSTYRKSKKTGPLSPNHEPRIWNNEQLFLESLKNEAIWQKFGKNKAVSRVLG